LFSSITTTICGEPALAPPDGEVDEPEEPGEPEEPDEPDELAGPAFPPQLASHASATAAQNNNTAAQNGNKVRFIQGSR
jgi:hypothetical protein